MTTMKEIIMANGNLKASEIGLGCMRIANLEKNTVNNLINTVENLARVRVTTVGVETVDTVIIGI